MASETKAREFFVCQNKSVSYVIICDNIHK